MGKHSLWSLKQWVWRKLRAEKRRMAQKEAEKARQMATFGKKPQGSAKRQLTSEQKRKAFPAIPWKVNGGGWLEFQTI